MKKILSLALTAVLSMSILAGCTGGKDEVAQGVTEDTIKVGNTAAAAGAFAAVGVPFNAGIEAYFKSVNDAGGIDGRKLELVHYDDEFDPVKGKAFTEQLINDDKVFALVGHFGTPTIGATLDLIKESGIPAVYFAAGISDLYNEEAVDVENGQGLYPVQPIYVTEGRLIVARAVEEHSAKKIGVIYTNDDAGKDLVAGVKNQVEKLGSGYSVVSEQVNPGATDVSSAVLKMKEENVDVIVAASIQATFPTIVKGLIAQGVNKPVFTTYSNADATTIANFAADYTAAAEKFPIYSNAWVDLSNADEVNAFVKGMTDFGKPDYAGNAYAMAGWIAGYFMVEGLKRVEGKTLSWENFMKGMEEAEFKMPMGGTVSYADGQRLGTQSMSLLKVNAEATAWENVKAIEDLNDIIKRIQ